MLALRRAEGRTEPVTVRSSDLVSYLGPEKFTREAAERVKVPGVAIGLVWTPYGGHVLFIEATRMPGGKRLILTGQLGDVMRESAEAALSYVRSRAEGLGVDSRFFDRSDIHIHVPAAGAPPRRPPPPPAPAPPPPPPPPPRRARATPPPTTAATTPPRP